IRLAIVGFVVTLPIVWAWWTMIRMPGYPHRGPLPALTGAQQALREELERHVRVLAERIGERHLGCPDRLAAAADYIAEELARTGRTPGAPRVRRGRRELREPGTRDPGHDPWDGDHR